MRPPRVAVSGLGWVFERAYLPQAGRAFEIVAVHDADRDRAAAMAVRLGVESVVTFDELLDAPADALFILTPPDVHASQVGGALARDRYIFCEKPVLRSLDEWQCVDAEHARMRIAGSATMRFRSDVSQLLELVRGGAIGAPRWLRLAWRRGAGVPMPGSWRTQRAHAPGGVLEDLAPHLLDLVVGILGPVPDVDVSFVQFGRNAGAAAPWFDATAAGERGDAPDTAQAILRAGDITFELGVSWCDGGEGDETIIDVEGTRGTARLTGLFGFSPVRRHRSQQLVVTSRDVVRTFDFPPTADEQHAAFGCALDAFAAFVRGHGPACASWDEIGFVAACLQKIQAPAFSCEAVA